MKVVSRHYGNYNKCGEVSNFMVWMLMGGHMRTLITNIKSVKTTMTLTTDCYFIGVISRKYVARYSWGHGMKISPSEFVKLKKINTTNVCESLSSTNQNLACETTTRYPKVA